MGSRALLLVLALLAPRLVALDAPVVELGAEPVACAPGAEVTIRVTYRWPSGWVVAEADPALAFAELTAVDYPPAKRVRTGLEERREWTVVVRAPAEPGPWALPRPAFTALGPDGAVSALAPLVVLEIGPDPEAVSTAAPRPLVVAPATSEPRWLAVAAAALALAVIAAGGWWWLGRPPRPPPSALAVFRRQLAAGASGKAGAADLGLALRRYLGASHGFDGAGATVAEASARVRGELPEHEHASLVAVLNALDAQRWAAPELPPEALATARAAASAWVEAAAARAAIARAARSAATTERA